MIKVSMVSLCFKLIFYCREEKNLQNIHTRSTDDKVMQVWNSIFGFSITFFCELSL